MVNNGNNNVAAPTLTSAQTADGVTTIQGTLTGQPLTTYVIELFVNEQPDPSGFGQGQTFLLSFTVTTDASGNASFSVSIDADVVAGEFITATATDPGNNMSAFSKDLIVVGV